MARGNHTTPSTLIEQLTVGSAVLTTTANGMDEQHISEVLFRRDQVGRRSFQAAPNALKLYRLCSYIHSMTTVRRTDEHNLRQAISEILEQTYAIEYAMGLFYRKGSERDLARAQDDIETMRAAVDRLASIIASTNQHDDAQAKVVQAAE
jgi:hypothetical protein